MIESAESLPAWHHMSRAKVIGGYYSGIDAGTPDYQEKINLPASSIEQAHYWLSYYADIYDVAGNVLELNMNESSTSALGGAIAPANAYLIDKKIDDGLASDGDIFTARGAAADGSSVCVSASVTAASATYSLQDETDSCRMMYWIEKD